MHKIDNNIGISHLNRMAREQHADELARLTLSMLFTPCWGSLARSAARFATMSNLKKITKMSLNQYFQFKKFFFVVITYISFKMAPSAATSDELLSNPESKKKSQFITLTFRFFWIYFTHFHKKVGRLIALSVEHADIPIAIPFDEYSIHHLVFYKRKTNSQF